MLFFFLFCFLSSLFALHLFVYLCLLVSGRCLSRWRLFSHLVAPGCLFWWRASPQDSAREPGLGVLAVVYAMVVGGGGCWPWPWGTGGCLGAFSLGLVVSPQRILQTSSSGRAVEWGLGLWEPGCSALRVQQREGPWRGGSHPSLCSPRPHPEGPGIPPISGEGPPVICQGTHQHSPGLTQFPSFSPSVVSDSLRPHGPQHARPPCPSPTPKGYSDSCPSSRWCHPAISSSVIPFSSRPQSLASSGSQGLGKEAGARVGWGSLTRSLRWVSDTHTLAPPVPLHHVRGPQPSEPLWGSLAGIVFRFPGLLLHGHRSSSISFHLTTCFLSAWLCRNLP